MPANAPIGGQASPSALTLNAREAAELLGYTDRQFRELVKSAHLPGPIDPTLPPKSWRWSRRLLESYAEGRWAA